MAIPLVTIYLCMFVTRGNILVSRIGLKKHFDYVLNVRARRAIFNVFNESPEQIYSCTAYAFKVFIEGRLIYIYID